MRWLAIVCLTALCACTTTRPVNVPGAVPWAVRVDQLQQASHWQLAGRAAVAMGSQGWQASLNWREAGADAEVHLAGPLGVGALVLKQTRAGLSLNDGPPGDAVLGQLQDRLGFELPLQELRFWLLGIPAPGEPFESMVRNAQDRVQQLTQAGWAITYENYLPAGADILPGRLVLSREGVRVRIVVDHWEAPP